MSDYHPLDCTCERHCRNCFAGLTGRQRLYCSAYCGQRWRAEIELDRLLSEAPTVPGGTVNDELTAGIEALHFVNGVRYKFPVVECRRCGGSGRYSFNLVDGDTCYGCSGSGVEYANKAVAKIVTEYRATVKAAKFAMPYDLKVGDEVIVGCKGRADKGDTWVTVTELVETDEWAGRSMNPDGTVKATTYRWDVTTSDGQTKRVSWIVRRRATGLPTAEAVAAADRAVEALVPQASN